MAIGLMPSLSGVSASTAYADDGGYSEESTVSAATVETFDAEESAAKAYGESDSDKAAELDAEQCAATPDCETSEAAISCTSDGEAQLAEQEVAVLDADEPQLVDGYYQIGTAESLLWFANKVNAGSATINGKLTADITVGELSGYVPIGNSSTNAYTGTFDGGNHVITMATNATSDGSGCLCYNVGSGAVIKNLNLSGSIESTKNYAAPFGIVKAATLQNITSNLTVSGSNYVAGLIGQLYSGTVKSCVVAGGSVTGASVYLGGFIAQMRGGTVTQCGNNATVNGSNNAENVGGFLGCTYNPTSAITISRCYNKGSVTVLGTNSVSTGSGGFVGKIDSNYAVTYTINLANCYNAGSIAAHDCIGGFAGLVVTTSAQNKANFSCCYNVGTVNHLSGKVTSYTGSFIGYAKSIYYGLNNCYVDGSTCTAAKGTSSKGTAKVTSKTTEEMKAAAFATTLGTYYKADGSAPKSINSGYPVLSWETPVDASMAKAGYSAWLTLGDLIEVNLRIDGLGEGFDAEKLGIAVTTVDDTTFSVSDVAYDEQGAAVTCKLKSVAPREISAYFTVQVSYDGDVVRTFTYSPQRYCEQVLAAEESDTITASLKALCKAIVNYGALAKDYSASDDSFAAHEALGGNKIDFTSFTWPTDMSALAVTNDKEVVSDVRAKLTLGSQVTINFRLKFNDSSRLLTANDVQIAYGSNNVVSPSDITVSKIEENSEVWWKVDVQHLDVSDLPNYYTLTLTGVDGFKVQNYGVYTYCKNSCDKLSGYENLCALCKSLVNYSEAAKAYIASSQTV